MKKKFETLETYRGFAALMIAAIHFKLNTPIVDHFLATGYFVHFFFTLSGFVIFYNYHDKIVDFFSLKKFVKKRFFRLYPLHLFFLLIFLAIEILRLVVKLKFNLESNIEPFEINNLNAFLANIFLIQTFLNENTFNSPSWSISAEFFTYLVFSLLIFFKHKNILVILTFILLLIYRMLFPAEFGMSYTYNSFIDCLYCFFIGALFCKIYLNKFLYFKSQNIRGIVTFLIILMTFISLKYYQTSHRIYVPFIFGLLIFFSADLDNSSIIGRILSNKFATYIGKISYSIYLSHLFIFWVVTQILRFLLNIKTYVDEETNFVKLDLDIYAASLVAIICYILTILFSHYTFKYIEMKFYKK